MGGKGLAMYTDRNNNNGFCEDIRKIVGESYENAKAMKKNYSSSPFRGTMFQGCNFFSIGNSHHYGNSGSKNDKSGAVAVAIIALAGLAYTFYSLGKSLGEYRNGSQGLQVVAQHETKLKTFQEYMHPMEAHETADRNRLDQMIELETAMYKQALGESRTSLIAKAVLVGSLSFIIIGAVGEALAATAAGVALAEGILLAGCVVTVLTGLFMLLRMGFNYGRLDTVEAKAEKLQTLANEIISSQGRVETTNTRPLEPVAPVRPMNIFVV